jgi:hypothetical protein
MVEQNDQNISDVERETNVGRTPKRSRIDNSRTGGRNIGYESGPGGFMRDVRTVDVFQAPTRAALTSQEPDSRGKRKAVETKLASNDDSDEEYSLAKRTRRLGYGNPK